MRQIDADALDSKLLSDGFFSGLSGALNGHKTKRKFTIGEIRTMLKEAPTIEPKCGKWNGWTTNAFLGLDNSGDPKFADRKFYRCSECRNGSAVKHNYCPKCGADMREIE